MLAKGVAKYYRKHIKGNENLEHSQIQRKLTRNIMLAYRVSDKHYIYGNLHIFVEGNQITELKNTKKKIKGFIIDKKRYDWLNKVLKVNNQNTLSKIVGENNESNL